MNKGTFSLLAAGLLLVACDTAPRTPVNFNPEVMLTSDPVGDDPGQLDLRATVTARDPVERVVFYRDGQLLGEDREAPYTWRDHIEDGVTYTYQAVAYDKAERRGASNFYDVTLRPTLESVAGKLSELPALTSPTEARPWTGGAGKLELFAGDQTVLSTPLAADGSFTFDLKQPPQTGWQAATPQNLLAPLGLAGCQGNASSSDPAVRMVPTQTRVNAGKSGPVAPFKVLPPTQAGNVQLNYFSLGFLVYAERKVNLTGQLTCGTGAGSTQVSLQLPLQQGWNKVTQQVTQPSGAAQPTQLSLATNFPLPEQWALLPQRP